MNKTEELRERIARWLFTFVREREDMKLNWEQTKGYYLQEADGILQACKEAGLMFEVRHATGVQWYEEIEL